MRLPDRVVLVIDSYPTAKAQWDWLIRKFGQPGYGDSSTEEGLTGEPPAVIGQGGSQRRRRRGKCHSCGEEGHHARNCHAPREEPATPLIAQEQSGASVQPETSPAHLTRTTDLEGEGCPLAEEGDTLAQIVGAEAVPSRQHPEDPTQEVHAQTAGAEPEVISGEPGAIEEVAHEHNDRAEPDLQEQPGDPNANTPKGVTHPEPDSMPGEDINPNANAPVHLEGTGPEVMLEEGGIAGENASVEEDRVPRIELQESGVSHLVTPEEDMFLTSSSSSSPPTTSEAARMQCSPAVSAGTPASPVPDHSADLEPPPHDTPPPKEAAKPPIHQPPMQTQAPTEAGGPMESLRGETSRRAMGQASPASACAPEGMMPIGEAHGRPPDLTDPQGHGPIVWEPASVVPRAHVCVHKAQRPVLDEGAHMRPDLWPNVGIVTIDPDIYIGSASLLEGEQNLFSPCAGSEQYASPCTPQISSSSPSSFPPLDTLARENLLCEEGTATERRATKSRRPKPLKLSNAHEEDLQKAGGVPSVLGDSPAFPEVINPFELVCVAEIADAEEVEPPGFDAYKRGGALLVAGAALALTESTTSVEPASKAEKAVAAKPEALVPWAQDKAGREVETPPREGERELDVLPPQGECMVKATPPQGEANRKVEMPSKKGKSAKCTEALPPEGEHERGATPQGVAKRKAERPPREGEREADKPPPEALPQKGKHNPEALSCKRKVEHPEAPPPDGEREHGTMPQGTPKEGTCKPSSPSRQPSHDVVLSTWEGPGPWDPGGGPAGERTIDSKGPVEAMNTTPGTVAHNKTTRRASTPARKQRRTWSHQKPVRGHTTSTTNHHAPVPHPSPQAIVIEKPIIFPFEAHTEGTASSWEMSRQSQCEQQAQRIATRPFGRRHTRVTRSHAHPRASHAPAHQQRSSTRGHNRRIKSLRALIFCLEAFRCSSQTVCEMRGSVANGARSESTQFTWSIPHGHT